ncbi:hypothetical protein POTOM_061244 [Populus tomentosa]|uniref:Hcy-binding domain-containing protein n=1 Tax=Populus tomentosa TaxID=118781 RepID=A0A8X7XYQ7_POPTO|nr:hypothetical protein POTOM_061244 [Populus tomentosa]
MCLTCQVHLDYLDAGANIILSASYQATIQGFVAKGLSVEEAESLLRRSVEIACEAREIYYDKSTKGSWDYIESGNISRRPVLVAASVGSYGAYLADGSEYSGKYGDAVSLETLKDFHRRRLQVLLKSGADLIAFETIPNKLEAKAYAQLLEEEGINIPAWFSFNSKDAINVVSGDSILECASIADSCKQVVAVGINCTPPRFIHGLVLSIRKATSKPIVIYPNSGETYNAELKQWTVSILTEFFCLKFLLLVYQAVLWTSPPSTAFSVDPEKSSGVVDEDFVSYINKWREAGGFSIWRMLCRTTPNTIRAIGSVLSKNP